MRLAYVAAGLLALLGVSCLTAAEEPPKSIKEMMAAHKKDQLRTQLTDALKKDAIDWEAVQKQTKVYAANAALLQKFKPPLGDEAGYKKLATAFSDAIKDVDKAAQAKDAKAANAALAKSGGMCMTCHKDHRPKPTN